MNLNPGKKLRHSFPEFPVGFIEEVADHINVRTIRDARLNYISAKSKEFKSN